MLGIASRAFEHPSQVFPPLRGSIRFTHLDLSYFHPANKSGKAGKGLPSRAAHAYQEHMTSCEQLGDVLSMPLGK